MNCISIFFRCFCFAGHIVFLSPHFDVPISGATISSMSASWTRWIWHHHLDPKAWATQAGGKQQCFETILSQLYSFIIYTMYIYTLGFHRLNKVCALQKSTNFERSCPSRSRHGAFTVTSPQHDIILSVVILSRCFLGALIYDYHLKLSSTSVRHLHIKGLGMAFFNEKQRFHQPVCLADLC